MGKRVFEALSYTPTATADGTTLSNATYQEIEATGPTMYIEVMEIYEGGQASASAINAMVFARNILPATTPTALTTPTGSDGFMKTFASPLASSAVCCVAAGTGPNRASVASQARLNLSFNAFGGIVRWVAAPGEEWGILGTTTLVSHSSLSSPTLSAGVMGSHIVYEIV
jgi:hypothetical protein